MKNSALLVSAILFALSSCGGGDNSKPETNPSEMVQETEKQNNSIEITSEILEVTIEGNDQMKFNLDRIDVSAGQTIKLTMKNVGSQPKEAMGHNWILLDKGTNVQDFAMAAIAQKENDYFPLERESEVLAHTKLLGPGESETIEFKAPNEPGVYKFICSFPGHFANMQGTFFVK